MLQTNDILEAVNRLTPEWLAGFFDGEGSVISQVTPDGRYASAGYTITQKDAKILLLIHLKYGEAGGVSSYVGANGAVCHRLRVRGRPAIRLLKDILPFSIVKRRQIELALKLLSMVDTDHKSEDIYDSRIELARDIKKLNREGNDSGGGLDAELERMLSK